MAQNTVDGCFARPLSTLDIEGIRDNSSGRAAPDGEIKYSLAFPKTYIGDLTHAKVVLVDRAMDGDRDAMIPDIVAHPIERVHVLHRGT